MQYFWYTYHDLPAGVGFAYFDEKHLTALGLTAVGIILCCLFFRNLSRKGQERMLKAVALLTAVGELARDVFLLCVGRMGMEYLPLHLCSLAIVVYLFHAWCPVPARNGMHPSEEAAQSGPPGEHGLRPAPGEISSPPKDHEQRPTPGKTSGPPKEHGLRPALGEIAYCLLLPGSVSALLFPNWTAYPMLTFMNLHSFIWHALLILYPVLLLIGGQIRPTLRHWWYPVVFLLAVTPPIYLFDSLTGYNYMFVLYPPAGTPLEWLYDLMGAWWRVGYALGALAVILLMLATAEIGYRVKERLRRRPRGSFPV